MEEDGSLAHPHGKISPMDQDHFPLTPLDPGGPGSLSVGKSISLKLLIALKCVFVCVHA